jgi:hypothetical protein
MEVGTKQQEKYRLGGFLGSVTNSCVGVSGQILCVNFSEYSNVLQYLVSQIQTVTESRISSEIHAIRSNLCCNSHVMNLLLQKSVSTSTCSFMSTYTVSSSSRNLLTKLNLNWHC